VIVVEHWRPVRAEIDIRAVRHNAEVLAKMAGPAALCAVVKADGYGHGAVAVARAALDGGATWLAVALVEEGVALREAAIDVPILLLSEPPVDAMVDAISHRLVPTVYSTSGVHAVARAVGNTELEMVDVHLKIDTGMHRVGAGESDVVTLADAIAEDHRVRLGGVWSHLAVADGVGADDADYTAGQLGRFERILSALAANGHQPLLTHIANSAASIALPRARREMVRCGIALYGALPTKELSDQLESATEGRRLRPVLSLTARVAFVRELAAGERPSYGRCRPLAERSVVATIPIGYADGVPRRFFDAGGEVLIGGNRRPLAGMVTMDQIVVDCGPTEAPGSWVSVGDEVVLIGEQGEQVITAVEWADRLGTISYEVLCGIGARVPRVVV
jgi:alanine racemase